MFSRIIFVTTALLIGGLYAVRSDRVGGMNRFADRLAVILDEPMINGWTKEKERCIRLHQATLLLHEAEEQRFDVTELIELSLGKFELAEGYSIAAQHSLKRNLAEAQDMGLFTDENRERILSGQTPLVAYGIFTGDRAEFRPVLDRHAAPGLDDNFLNMRYTVESQSDNKSRRPGTEAVNLAHSLFCASLIDSYTFSRLIRRSRS